MLYPSSHVENLLARVDDDELREELRSAWRRKIPAERQIVCRERPHDRSMLGLKMRFRRDWDPQRVDVGWICQATGRTSEDMRVDTLANVSIHVMEAMRGQDVPPALIGQVMQDTVRECVWEALATSTFTIHRTPTDPHVAINWRAAGECPSNDEHQIADLPGVILGERRLFW